MRNRILLSFCILSLLLTTGCWSRTELNEIAFVAGMAIDKSNDQFQVSIQVVEPEQLISNKASGGRAPVALYTSSAHTVSEALRKITTTIPRKPYMAQLRALVISESLAKEGIRPVLDFLSRNHEFRTDFYIVIAKGMRGADVSSVFTKLEKIPANKLFASLQTSEQEWAPTKTITIDRLIDNLASTGKSPVITGIELPGSLEKSQSAREIELIKADGYLTYSGIAVFRKDKLIGWLNESESKGYNYIRGDVKRTIGHVECPKGGKIAFDVYHPKVKVKSKVKGGQPQIDIHLRYEANVTEVACSIDLTKMSTIADLERRLSRKSKKILENVIRTTQTKYQTDIFGFGEVIYRTDPQVWKRLEKDWDRHFAELPVQVQVDVEIRNLGTLHNSYVEEMKKIK